MSTIYLASFMSVKGGPSSSQKTLEALTVTRSGLACPEAIGAVPAAEKRTTSPMGLESIVQ
jgi:hypothetical protein